MKYVVFLLLLAGCVSTPANHDADNLSPGRASAKIHTELAGMYYERSQLGVALAEIDTALKADGNYAPAYNVRGLIQMTLREDKEAESSFQQSLKLDKSDSETHNNFGWFLCQRARPAESIPHFLAALKNPLYTTPERAYLNAGVCSQKAGNYQEAEDFLQRALLLRPNMPQALLGMAEASFAKGAFHTANRYFSEYSAKVDGLSADNLLLAVRIQRAIKDTRAEAEYTAQLRRNYPDSTQARVLNLH